MRLNLFFFWNFFFLYCFFNNMGNLPIFNNYLIFITSNSVFYFNFLFYYFILLFYFYLYCFPRKFYLNLLNLFTMVAFILCAPTFGNFCNLNNIGCVFQKNHNWRLLSIFFDFAGPGLLHGVSFLLFSSFNLSVVFFFFFKQNSLANFLHKHKWFNLLQLFVFFFINLYILLSGAYWAFFSEIWANWYNNDIIEIFYILYFFFCMLCFHNLTKRYFLFSFTVYSFIVVVIFLTTLRLGFLTSKHTSVLHLKNNTGVRMCGVFLYLLVFCFFSKFVYFKFARYFVVNLWFECVVVVGFRVLEAKKNTLKLFFWVFLIINGLFLFIFLIFFSNAAGYMFFVFMLFFNFLTYGFILFILFWFFNDKFLQTLKKTQNQAHLFFIYAFVYLFYLLWNFFSIKAVSCVFLYNTSFIGNCYLHFSQYFLNTNSYTHWNQLACTQVSNLNLNLKEQVKPFKLPEHLSSGTSFRNLFDVFRDSTNLPEKRIITTSISNNLNFTGINYKNYFECLTFFFLKVEYDFVYSQATLLFFLFILFVL